MSRSPARVVCVIGSLNVDTTLRVASLPGAGETVLARGRSIAQGGKGANQAVAAASQGSRVTLVAAVGDDADGRASLDGLGARDVDMASVRVLPDASTGTALVLVADDGENLIVVDQGANAALDEAWVRDRVTAADPDVVVAQLEVPISAVVAAAEAFSGRYFILNPAPTPLEPDAVAALLAHTDVLVPNRPELAWLAGEDEPQSLAAVDRCARKLAFPGTLVVTLGGQGAAVYAPYGESRIALEPPPAVDVVDTTGAGDAFCGVLADRLARGFDVVAAVRDATRLASISTTVPGAQVPASFPSFGDEIRSGNRPQPEASGPRR